jgi:hypothetical protein
MANFRPANLKQGQPFGGTTRNLTVTSGSCVVAADTDTFYLMTTDTPYNTPIYIAPTAREAQRVTLVCNASDSNLDGVSISSGFPPFTYQGPDVILFHQERATFCFNQALGMWFLESYPGEYRKSSGVITYETALDLNLNPLRITPSPVLGLIVPISGEIVQYYETGATPYVAGSLRFGVATPSNNFGASSTVVATTAGPNRNRLLVCGFGNYAWQDFQDPAGTPPVPAIGDYNNLLGQCWYVQAPVDLTGGNALNYFYYNFVYRLSYPAPM